ncbi:MAG: hypothetical protein EZS28_002273 [Streblomastix strix]|uniref:Uncharacterized protein n=1 Tax=Streblomastix strix TaxID=222440 RepID=A0A5J4X6D7_9EUKA|nr:MAG: hypothetical protein EZS28_002273 [Streblomastix strix]
MEALLDGWVVSKPNRASGKAGNCINPQISRNNEYRQRSSKIQFLDISLQRRRRQHASTSEEVRVCLVKALTSVTEALEDLHFVIRACLMDGPIYGYWVPAFVGWK